MAKKSNLADLLAQAKKAIPRASNVWSPQAGDAIAGVILKKRTNKGRVDPETKERSTYSSLTLATDSGEEVVVNCGYLLEQELKEQGAEVGDSVAIIYDGQGKTASGNKIHSYRVALEKG